MNLDQFAHSRGLELDALVSEVGRSVGLWEGDRLLAVGSLVEELGTTKSDLDLILITPREHALPAEREVAIVVGRCLVDLRVVSSAALDDLLARLSRWARFPWDVSDKAPFTLEERVLLHRLLRGPRLWPVDLNVQDTLMRPPRDAIARLNLHVARHFARTIQVDMVGHRDGGDHRSLIFAGQELLGHAIDALHAAHGMTNPLSKWRSRLLEAVPADWEAWLSVRPSGMSAGERYWELHRAPAHPGREAAELHALRITTFARSTFAWAERRLVHDLTPADGPYHWPRLEREPLDSVLPALDFDVDFVSVDGGAVFARLNEFGETLGLSGREFAMALLCDGITTAREAEAMVGESSNSDGQLAERVGSRIRAAQLSVG